MPNPKRSVHAGRLLPLAIVALLAGASPAAAQQDGPTHLQKFFGILGLLEIPSGDDNIDYRERAPLVVPPSSALIPPRSPDDIAKYNPDWPLDHNDKRRSAKGDPEVARKNEEDFYSGRALRPSELARGRISREEATRRDAQARANTESAGSEYSRGAHIYSPAQLGFKGWGAKQEERVVFSGEPERRALTDPPPGLRTPSQDAPFGVVSKKAAPVKASTLYERVTNSNDPNNRQ